MDKYEELILSVLIILSGLVSLWFVFYAAFIA